MHYNRMGLSLDSSEHGALKLTAADGQGPRSFYQEGLILDCKESHHGWVFQHQKPIVKRDLQSELEFRLERPNLEEGIRSYCAVPLIARGQSVGVFIVLSSQRSRYSDVHAEFLQEVSDQFVLAVKALMPACPKHSHTKLISPDALRRAEDRPLWQSTRSTCRTGASKAAEEERRKRVALGEMFEVKICRGKGVVLPGAPADPNGLSSVHRKEGRKGHDP